MKKIIIIIAAVFVLFIVFVAIAQLTSLDEAKKEAMEANLEGAVNNLTVVSEIIFNSEGSYSGFSCDHEEAAFICEGIEELTGEKPTIHASESDFCLYGEFAPDNYYCADKEGAYQVVVYPGEEGYCSGDTYTCPAASVGN